MLPGGAEVLHPAVTHAGTVDDDPEWKSQLANQIHCKLEIVKAEGRRLRHQYHKIAVSDGGQLPGQEVPGGASRITVSAPRRVALDGPNQGGNQGHANIEPSLNQG